jgi:hypothetical protein
MTVSPRLALVLLAGVATTTPSAVSQTCPGQVASPLQAMIDAAQPGDVLVLFGGENSNCSVCVTKPLTFVGMNPGGGMPTILGISRDFPVCGSGCIYPGPTGVFYIHPAVSGVVAFRNLKIVGQSCYVNPDKVMHGIYSAAPGAVVVVDGCEIRGGNYEFGVGDGGPGATGIEGTLSRLVVRESAIFGGNAEGFNIFPPFCFGTGGSGGHAVDVNGEVLLIRSVLTGGTGGNVGSGSSECCGMLQFANPGAGGSAVIASVAWSWGSMGTGGLGGLKLCNGIQGQGPSGSNLPPGGLSLLDSGAQPQPGGIVSLSLQIPPAANFYGVGASLDGWGATLLMPSVAGPYFLGTNPQLLAFGYAATVASFGFAVPNEPSLVGAMIPIQGVTGTTGTSSFEITNPDFVLIRP